MKHVVPMYVLLAILLMIAVGFAWGSFRKEAMTTGPTPGYYEASKIQIHATDNEIQSNIVTIDNRGHIVNSELDTTIYARPHTTCLEGGTYNPDTHQCECPPGFTYSTLLGCLSDCAPYQTYVSNASGTDGQCANVCSDPTQYYNTTTGQCQSCPVGYQANDTNLCTPLPACELGQVYDATGSCVPCPDGQTAGENNQCMNICLDYQVYDALSGDCQSACKRNEYMDFTVGSGTCVPCPRGYINDGTNRCVMAPECPAGQSMDAHANCVSQCLSWETYDPVIGVCIPKCNVRNAAGYYTEYLDLKHTDTCVSCGPGMIGDGANGCMQGPTAPPITCPPGYKMNHGTCEMPCAPWRKYDIHTDSCILRCHTQTQHWDDTIKGCVQCPPGYKVDGFNQCTVPIPKAPVYNTPAPTCPPGYAKYTDGTCVSTCPDYATNNSNDPLVCDFKCAALNQYWDATNTAGTGCSTCTHGYTTDATNQCHECDEKADFLPAMYKHGTLGYAPVQDAVMGASSTGYTCQPQCTPGYLVNTDTNAAGYNTCSVCDSAPNPSLFVVKYMLDSKSGSATQGQCMPVCSAPNVLNVDNLDPAHPCNLCMADYTMDILDNNPNKVQADVDPNLRRCMPMKCDTGYIIGSDFKCSACDAAAGYTNDLAQVDPASKSPLVKYPSNTHGKCFPKVCPNNTALGADFTCSVCASGNYGDPKAGCAPPNDDIKVLTVDKIKIGSVTVAGNMAEDADVNVDKFVLDFTLSVAMSNFAYATATLGSQTKPLTLDKGSGTGTSATKTGTITFTGVVFTGSDLTLTVNYYDTAATTGVPVNTSSYRLNYDTYAASGDDTTIQTGDFAVAYMLVGGGGGGGSDTQVKSEGGDGCWQGANSSLLGPVCPIGTIVSIKSASKCCPIGSFDAFAQTCCGKGL